MSSTIFNKYYQQHKESNIQRNLDEVQQPSDDEFIHLLKNLPQMYTNLTTLRKGEKVDPAFIQKLRSCLNQSQLKGDRRNLHCPDNYYREDGQVLLKRPCSLTNNKHKQIVWKQFSYTKLWLDQLEKDGFLSKS